MTITRLSYHATPPPRLLWRTSVKTRPMHLKSHIIICIHISFRLTVFITTYTIHVYTAHNPRLARQELWHACVCVCAWCVSRDIHRLVADTLHHLQAQHKVALYSNACVVFGATPPWDARIARMPTMSHRRRKAYLLSMCVCVTSLGTACAAFLLLNGFMRARGGDASEKYIYIVYAWCAFGNSFINACMSNSSSSGDIYIYSWAFI